MTGKSLLLRLAAIVLTLVLTAVPATPQHVGVEVPLERTEATPSVELEPEAGKLRVSLTEAIAIALERNQDLHVLRNAYRDSVLGVLGARGLFDLQVRTGLSTSESTSPTVSELDGAPVLVSESQQGSLGLAQQTPLGGQFSLNWSASRSETNSEFSTLNPSYGSGLTFGYTQPLSQGFGRTVTRSEIAIAEWSRDIGRSELEGQVIATVQQVANAYWDLVEAWQQLQVAEEALELAEELHEQNQIRVEVGTLAPLELVQSESGVANQQVGILRARAAVGNAADRLRLILDLDQGPLWTAELVPETEPTPQPLEIDLEEALGAARRQRVELLAQEVSLERSRLQQTLARSQARPRVDLDLSYSVNGVAGDQIDADTGQIAVPGGLGDALDQIVDAEFDGWQVGVQVAYPLQNRTARAQRARAEIALDNAERRYRVLAQQIATEVRTAARNLESAWQQVKAARAATRLAEESLEAEQTRFEEGMSTSFLVLQAQNELTAARSQEVSATVGYDRAVIDYHRAVGNLLETTGIRLAGKEETS